MRFISIAVWANQIKLINKLKVLHYFLKIIWTVLIHSFQYLYNVIHKIMNFYIIQLLKSVLMILMSVKIGLLVITVS